MSQTDSRPPQLNDTEFEQACQFVMQLVSQAHRYGVSFVRLGTFIAQLSSNFGFRGQMLATPPFLLLEFWRPTDTQPRRFIHRLPEESFDLSKLSQLGSLVNKVVAGKVPFDKGTAGLKQIDSLQNPYGNLAVALGYSLCGAGFAVLLSATWRDVFFAAVLSLVVFAITLYAGRSQWLAKRINFTAALAASLLANVIALLFPGSDPFTVTLCAVVVLVPGLALTLGIAELASKSVISGMERLIDGVLITFALVVGSAIGSSVVSALWTIPAPAAAPDHSLGVTFFFILLLMLGLAFIFQVRRRDLGWAIIAGGLAYAGVLIGGQFGDWQGSFLGALVLGIYASLFTFRLHLSLIHI